MRKNNKRLDKDVKSKTQGRNRVYRGKPRNKKDTRRDADYGKSEEITNDPAFYNQNAQLANTSANVFFTKPFGGTFDVFDDTTFSAAFTGNNVHYAAPGIMVLNVTPAFGPNFGENDVSPLNITMQADYSFIRHANSGHSNYDGADLMTFMVGMADVYSIINWMQRLYATINRYYPENRYYARHVVQAMGVDFDSFQGNMAQFNWYINNVIAKASAFAIPSNLPFFTRRASIYGNIYQEDESIKDQLYFFNPNGFYKYTVDSNYDEAYLKYEPFGTPGVPITFSYLQTYVNDMLQRFLDMEDIGIMSGDIIKAYGSNILKLSMFPSDVLISPVVHDYNVLYQIRNATVVQEDAFTPPDLHQDSSKQYLTWDNKLEFSSEPLAARNYHKELLTSTSSTPTTDEVLESTRLMATAETYSLNEVTNKWEVPLLCGTEVITSFVMYRFKKSNGVLTMQEFKQPSQWGSYSGANWSTFCAFLSNFKYHPTVWAISGVTGDQFNNLNGALQDMDNVVALDQDTLYNLHQTAIMSMLAIPAIAML